MRRTPVSRPPTHAAGMPNVVSFTALLIPYDDRIPHLVTLPTSPLDTDRASVSAEPFRCGRRPHPEVCMDYIADRIGSSAWTYKVS